MSVTTEPKKDLEELDLSKITAQFFLKDHVARMMKVINNGRTLRDSFSKEQKEILDETNQNPELGDLNLAIAISKMPEESVVKWEANLQLVDDCISDDVDSLLSHADVNTLTLFLALMRTLKDRSRRHLDNFLEAAADGEWVDALIIAKGNDSEFRTIDHCSDEARAEFGIKK